MNNHIPVKDTEMLKSNGIHFTPKTLYTWHHLKKFPGVFVKIGGRLFLVLSEWNRQMEVRRLQQAA